MPRRVTLDPHRLTRTDGRPFFLIGARHIPEGGSPQLLTAEVDTLRRCQQLDIGLDREFLDLLRRDSGKQTSL